MTNPPIDPFKRIFCKDPSIVARQIAGEMILVPIRQTVDNLSSIYLLNETALFAWQLMDGTLSLGEIRLCMIQEFDVDEVQVGQDLLGLVTDLEKLGALKKV
jgi:hypothetical protein